MSAVASKTTYLLKLQNRYEVAERNMAFEFEKPEGFVFKAGQAIDMTVVNPPETGAPAFGPHPGQTLIKQEGEDVMEPRDIYITKFDLARLKELLEVGITFKEQDREYLESLRNELDRAHIVEPTALPGDVVTMNSRVRLKDMDTGEVKNYSLVFPAEADMTQNKISILAPIGTAILGYRAGDTVDWQVPAGRRRVRIEEILYQPEAAGHYDY